MDDFVIQVKSGKADGLVKQIKATVASGAVGHREVIGYAPDKYSAHAWRAAAAEGIPVARNLYELVAIIKERQK